MESPAVGPMTRAEKLMSNLHQPDADIRPVYSAEAILAHPRFAAVRRAYLQENLGLHENYPALLNRELIDAGCSLQLPAAPAEIGCQG